MRHSRTTHFEDYSGTQFERLVFAYHLRAEGKWDSESLEWLGEAGDDGGRDILGVLKGKRRKAVCVLCANWKKLTFAKVSKDITKAIKAGPPKPTMFRVVAGHSVSSVLRKKIKGFSRRRGVRKCEVWSGSEFEERLHAKCEALLQRFRYGVEFPDTPDELGSFVKDTPPDEEILAWFARVFDRPAFTTPFQSESSLPAFQQAIGDTIQAINTGIWQTRDGKEIERIPTRHDLAVPANRNTLARIEQLLKVLRAEHDEFLRSGDIRSDGCPPDKCSVFISTPRAIASMNHRRAEILALFRSIYPPFSAMVGLLGNSEASYPGAELAIRLGSMAGPFERPRKFEKLPRPPER